MEELLNKTFYGNTIENWTISLFIILGGALLGRIIFWIFKKWIAARAKKLKKRFVEIIVDLIEEPIAFGVVILCMLIGVERLHFSEGFDQFLQKIFNILWTLNVTWLIARLWSSFVEHYLTPLTEKSENTLDDALIPILKKGIRSIIWIVGVIVGLNNAGYDVGALIAGLGIGGMALALAAKDSLSNLFGGMTIFLDKPFKMGDRILVDGIDGTVIEIGIRTTRIKTLAGRLVTIPNSKFNGNIVENITLEPSRKIILNLGLTYDTPPAKMEEAMDVLREISTRHAEHLSQDSLVSFTTFGDFSLGILYVYYIKPGEDILGVQNKMNLAILSEFNSRNLDFAFPSQTLYLEKND